MPGWPYEVSDLGRVRSIDRKLSDGREAGSVILAPTLDGKGYPTVTLRGGKHVWKVRVHRLVKLVHTGPARGRQVRHVDDVKTDTRLSRLKYGTAKQNRNDRTRNERRREGKKTRERKEQGKRGKEGRGKQDGIDVASWVPAIVSGCFT